MPKLGPYSRSGILGWRDGRSREARLLKSIKADLVGHVGGSPSTAQLLLIDEAAELKLRLVLFQQKFAQTGAMTKHDSDQYLAWSNSFSRALRHIGLKATSSKSFTPVDDFSWSPDEFAEAV